MQKIGFVSLGCPKALVDSERIITRLRAEGYQLVNEFHDAGLVIVNTCGFIDAAKAESLASIQQALAENGKVIVTGCLGAKADEIKSAYPDVLHISGPQAYESVMGAVHTHLPPTADPFQTLIPPHGIKLTPRHYAYLKISEGCNHHCTFCIIPSMRGKLQSRPIDEVMTEAESLVKGGVKELLIVSQDTSAYGVDTKYEMRFWNGRPLKTRFTNLCEALGHLGVWVRLHYVYPYPHVSEIIPLMAEGKILPYLDIPFQHASPTILKSMKRPGNIDNTLEQIHAWRDICPDITLRSTFIVGFPGETKDDFQRLLDFLDEAELDRVGCFQYSPVEGAAANALPNAVPDEIKAERYHAFMQKQSEISARKLRNTIGKTLTVLIDEVSEDRIVGRSAADAPEIDGSVYLPLDTPCQVGDFVTVRITDTDEYDRYADPL